LPDRPAFVEMRGKVSQAGFRQAFHQGVRAATVIVAQGQYRCAQLPATVHGTRAVCSVPSRVLRSRREVLRECYSYRQPVRILPFSQPESFPDRITIRGSLVA
jgi:hypothetical protein